jgi:ATP/ADP translocase/HEAT repeat protein
MNRILAALFGLRFGERRMALMMTAYHFLLLVTLYLLKPVRDSLFLNEIGARELPFVFMLTTVAVLPLAALHVRAGRRLRLSRLVNGVGVILVLNLLGLRWLVQMQSAWVYYLLYAWVSIYAVLVTSQFWLLANGVFTGAKAKRVFPLLSVGAILGAVVGGEVTGLLVDRWGMRTENLLLVGAGLLAASSLIVIWVRRKSEGGEAASRGSDPSESAPANLFGVVKTLRTSRHLQLVIGVIALAVVTTTFVDYQFKTVAAAAFPAEGELTTFMGRFYGRVSLIAFVVQVFLAPRLIRMLGVGGALSFLPLTLALGSVGMIVFGGLWAGTALRGIDQSLKHSIDKTGRELLFVPVDLEKKKRVKVFIDLFFDQGMQGLGGLLLLFLTLVAGVTVEGLSVVVLGLLAVWVGLVVWARSSYINEFRDVLSQDGDEQAPDDDPSRPPARRAMTFDEVRQSLSSRSGTEVVQGLKRLEAAREGAERKTKGEDAGDARSAPPALPVEALRQLLDHRMAEVRRRAIRLLRQAGVKGHAEAVAVHLEDPDAEVRLEAARYLYRNLADGAGHLLLQQGLDHDDLRVRAAAVGLIAKDGGPEERALLTEPLLRELVTYSDGEAAEEARLEVARALGVVEWDGRDEMLTRLMDDPAPAVAERAVKSAGQTGERAFVAPLLKRLQRSEERQNEARRSLAAFGARIQGTLYDYLTDEQTDERLRRRLPGVLAMEGTQAAVDVLLLSRGRVPVPVWHEVVRALSRLRQKQGAPGDDRGDSASENSNTEGGSPPPLRFPEEPVREAVRGEAARYAALGQVMHRLRQRPAAPEAPASVSEAPSSAPAAALGADTLRAARRRSLERLCRLLGLRYRQDDLHNAYRGLTSENAALRSSALEFLDNVLEWDLKRDLLPLLDDPDGRRAADQAPGLFGLPEMNRWSDALIYLIERSGDPELAALALREAKAPNDDGAPALRDAVEAATRHPNPTVRTAAREAAGRADRADDSTADGTDDSREPPAAADAPERSVSSMK